MPSILVPTDLSASSVIALKYALYIAKALHFRVKLLYIVDLPEFERFLVEEVIKEQSKDKMIQKFKDFVAEKVLEEKPELKSITIDYLIEEGNVTGEIVKMAKAIDPVLIAMGAKGSGSNHWSDFWLGGTTKRVAKKANAPVLVIPDGAEFSPIKKIAFADDFATYDFETIDLLINFGKKFNAKVEVVHVKTDANERIDIALKGIESNFKKYIENHNLEVRIIEGSNISNSLNEYVAKNDISMLAVLDEKDSLVTKLLDRSLSFKIASHAKIPTIVFKEA